MFNQSLQSLTDINQSAIAAKPLNTVMHAKDSHVKVLRSVGGNIHHTPLRSSGAGQNVNMLLEHLSQLHFPNVSSEMWLKTCICSYK